MDLNIPKVGILTAAVLLAAQSFSVRADQVPAPTLGETIIVAGIDDAAPTPCSGTGTVTCANLRSAVVHANTNDNGDATAPKYDRIVLANGSVHTLTLQGRDEGATASGDLDILSHVTIETDDLAGAAATIAGGAGFGDRLLDINSPPLDVTPAASVIVNLTNLVLTNGQGVYMNGGAIYANDGAVTTITRSLISGNKAEWDGEVLTKEVQGSGGGIYSKGALTISLSVLSANYAQTIVGLLEDQKNGNGGAIYASQATTIVDSTIGGEGAGNYAVNGGGIQMAGGNKLEILRSTFSHNDAVSGGAINVVSPSASPFTVTNSTISANHVTDAGAGINTNASVTILNSTIANNVKDSGNKGSGINQFGGTATLKNTLLAGNTGGGVSANCGATGAGELAIVSGGGNLSTDGTCSLTLSSDQQNVADPKLGPLALNDNQLNDTLTHALLDGSPAIDKAITDGCPSSDQRGSVRPFDAVTIGTRICDIGAYEVFIDRKDLAIVGMIAMPERLEIGLDSKLTVQLSNTDPNAATGVVLTTVLPSGVSFVSGSFAGGACGASGSTVTCSIGTLTANTQTDVTMLLGVNSAGANVVTSTVSSSSADPYESNNTASVTLVGLTNADLNLSAVGSRVEVNSQGTATFTVLNQGNGDAKNVVLTGSVPDGMALVAVSDASLCAVSGSAFSCTFPEILANASRSVTLTVTAAVAASYDVTASVTGDVIDADSTDNTATATVGVVSEGGGGGGCTMSPNAGFDVGLLGLLAAGLAGLAMRRRRRA